MCRFLANKCFLITSYHQAGFLQLLASSCVDLVAGKMMELHRYHTMGFEIPVWADMRDLTTRERVHALSHHAKGGLTHLVSLLVWFLCFGFCALPLIKNSFRICWAFLSGTWQEHLGNIEEPLPWHGKKIAGVDLWGSQRSVADMHTGAGDYFKYWNIKQRQTEQLDNLLCNHLLLRP